MYRENYSENKINAFGTLVGSKRKNASEKMRSAAYCCVYATENYIKPTFNWEQNSFPACDKDRMRMRLLCTAWDGNTHSHGIVCFILKCFLFYFSLLRCSSFFLSFFFKYFFSSAPFHFYFLLPILIYVMQPIASVCVT